MKILYILHSTDVYGGSIIAFKNILLNLLKNGIKPLVILPDTKGLFVELNRLGIDVITLNYRNATFPPLRCFKDYLLFLPRTLGRIWLNLKVIPQLECIVKNFSPDIIHSNVSVVDIGYVVAKKNNIPHIFHLREYAKLCKLYHFYGEGGFIKLLNLNNSYSISITKDVKKYYKQALNANAVVIYDGVMPKNRIRFNDKKEPYFLFVGRLEKIKGVKELIEQYAVFVKIKQQTNIKLKIAGDSLDYNYKEALSLLVKTLGVEDKVEFLGQRKDVYDLMYNAYALFVPSYSEGFGFITAEAMFNGCLVVGRDTAGTKEQFDNGLDLLKEDIALRFIGNEEISVLMKQIDENGIEYYYPMIKRSQEVVKLYSIEESVNNVYGFYKEILNENRRL